MSKVIVLASGKGGTGKSTVSVGLAVALVKLNKKVLLVDCDSGMRGVDLMLGVMFPMQSAEGATSPPRSTSPATSTVSI